MTDARLEFSEFYGSSVLNCAFTIVRRHFPALLLLAIANFAASRGFTWVAAHLASSFPGQDTARSVWTYISIVPTAFIDVLFAGIIAHRAWADVVGERTSLAQDIETTVPECTTLLGIQAARFVVLLAPALPLILFFILSNTAVYPGLVPLRRLGEFALAIGGLAVLAGTVVASIAWIAAVPIAIVERLGVLAALQRSARLSLGFRAQIFAMLFLFSACAIAPLIAALRSAGLPTDDPSGFSTFAGALTSLYRVAALMVYPVICAATYLELLRIELGPGSPSQKMPQP